MQLSKRQSRVIAFGTLALFFIAIVIFLPNSKPKPPELVEAEKAAPVLEIAPPGPSPTAPSSTVLLKEFHRSEIKNGRKIWEVTGTRGEYITESGAAKIYDANLTVYRDDGSVVNLKATEATLAFSGATLAEANLSGEVVLHYNDSTTLETSEVSFRQADQSISSSKPVHIYSPDFDITGTGLTGQLDSRTFKLMSNVTSKFFPKGESNAH